MSVRYLADYMAASERVKRSVIRESKYRSTAKVVQHDEAKLAIGEHIRGGHADPDALRARAEYIRNKLADDDFDRDVNAHNADYVDSFADALETFSLPSDAEPLQSPNYPIVTIHGLEVSLKPNLALRRINKRTNKVCAGTMMFRYAKAKPLPTQTGLIQAAIAFGLLCEHYAREGEEYDRNLCLTLYAVTGETFAAPTNAKTIYNNTKAACATIADAWDNIKPPPKAVL